MLLKKFKNGNVNVKLETDDKKDDLLIDLINNLYDLDFGLFGEEYCLNNFTMGVDLYDYYNNKVITIIYSELYELKPGYTLKLYSRCLNDYDTELYNELVERDEL